MVARLTCYANNMRLSFFAVFMAFLLLGLGCRAPAQPEAPVPSAAPDAAEGVADVPEVLQSAVVYPVEDYSVRMTKKKFGQYVRDRFTGYHAGDDIEFTSAQDQAREIPVVAIADGEVVRVGRVGGYGGLLIVRFVINGRVITALYGHIDLGSTELRAGDLVTRGQFLANLGDHESAETDGERKHLHFGVYEGSDGRVNGYESTEAGLTKWLDPSTFLASGG